MFWRFSTFQNGSSIDSLLDKEDVSLEAILDEDDLLQECKSQNPRLIDYFERASVLKRLLGYVTGQIEGEDKGRFKYPYIATEVLCSDIWSIVETCINEQQQLLVPFWETVLDRSPDDMKTQMTMAAHFAKINSTFMAKKPAEMLAFIQSQPGIVDKLLLHVETPSFIDLLGRIIQLDEHIPDCNVLEWLSSQNFMGRLIQLLSPNYTPSIHNIIADLIKNIISLATPSPGVGLTDGTANGPPSNRFARELAAKGNVTKLVDYMLMNFSEESCKTPTGSTSYDKEEDEISHRPTFESHISSVVQSIAVVVELIRKNNSDYSEPYLFHTLRNRLIQVQQQTHLQGEDIREALEQVMTVMVNRMGVVNLGPLLDALSARIADFQHYLRAPRSLTGPISTTVGRMTPFLLERYRIVELYAELLHCSNMSLLNRAPSYARMYDAEGRLQGGLGGLEELAQVIAQNSGNDQDTEPADDMMNEVSPALDFPVRSASDDSTSLDSDDVMSDSDHLSDDETMEEIAMFDEPQTVEIASGSPLSVTTEGLASPLSASAGSTPLGEVPSPLNDSMTLSSPRSEVSVGTSRSSKRTQGSRKSSRSRKRTMESSMEIPLPVGERLKKSLLQENVLVTMIDLFFEFPWNNFLHSAVYDIVHQVMTGNVESGYNRDLVISLFRDAKILHRIIEGQAVNDRECSKPKGIRLGYMGHLMLISEDVITAMARFPPEIRLSVIQFAPEPQWDEYVTGRYNETKKEDNKLLGGGKPSVNPAARSTTAWKVDEDELKGDTGVATRASGSTSAADGGGTGEMKGEFKRVSSGTVRSTADFGPAPAVNEDLDDDDNVSSGRSTHFARFLASEMGSHGQFGSSSDDDEDDDEGWLTQSTFTLGNATLASRSFGDRRPLSTSGFGDAFDPSSTSMSEAMSDPFATADDDGFGPFADPSNGGSGGETITFSSSFSDEDSFESFGDFGDFQAAEESLSDGGGANTPTTNATSESWMMASGMSGFGDDFGSSVEESSSSGTTSAEADSQPKSDSDSFDTSSRQV